MGRRSRNRAATAPPPPRTPADERPKPPWHPFPLVELCALAGIVLIVLGLLDLESDRGLLLLLAGMVLGSLAGLETALREHFSGYKSHAAVLAGIPGVAAAAGLYFSGVPWPVVVVGAAAAFGGALLALGRAYR